MWLSYDAYWRAQVAPRRVKIEQRLRANAAHKGGLAQLGRPQFLELLKAAHDGADEAERAFGVTDPLRPPIDMRDAGKLQTYAGKFSPAATPLWCGVLGVSWRAGSNEALNEIGKQSSLGAFAVTVSGSGEGTPRPLDRQAIRGRVGARDRRRQARSQLSPHGFSRAARVSIGRMKPR